MDPEYLEFKNINPIVRKDDELREKETSSIEDYVERLYNGNR